MKRTLGAVALALFLCAAPASVSAQSDRTESAQQQAFAVKVKDMLRRQHPQKGDIAIPAAKATLHLGTDYYYLNAAEAKEVIIDMWGNPASSAEGGLGLVFPAGKTFVDEDAWGAVITYEDSGYVTDDDAKSADYDALLNDMKAGEETENKQRAEAGYPAIHLVGWAERPTYDGTHHSVVWARNIGFAANKENSLNYDVRLLGRFGVLSLNMVSTMSHLPEVKAAAAKFGASATFDQGARYADFVPDVDKTAGYGIAGLVAAGAGVAVAKKLGLIAIILAFGKKLLIPIVLLFGVLGRRIKGLFGRKSEAEVEVAPPPLEEAEDSAVEAREKA